MYKINRFSNQLTALCLIYLLNVIGTKRYKIHICFPEKKSYTTMLLLNQYKFIQINKICVFFFRHIFLGSFTEVLSYQIVLRFRPDAVNHGPIYESQRKCSSLAWRKQTAQAVAHRNTMALFQALVWKKWSLESTIFLRKFLFVRRI